MPSMAPNPFTLHRRPGTRQNLIPSLTSPSQKASVTCVAAQRHSKARNSRKSRFIKKKMHFHPDAREYAPHFALYVCVCLQNWGLNLEVSAPDLFCQGSASGGSKEKPQNVQELMQKAASRAFGGGISGATAGVLQVHQKPCQYPRKSAPTDSCQLFT